MGINKEQQPKRGLKITEGIEIISCLIVMSMAILATFKKQRALAQVKIKSRAHQKQQEQRSW